MEILVVDDDQALCRSLQLHLEHEGHQVTTVHTGTEGLGRITSGDFDVIFLDLNLPDAYGLDLLREARLIQDNALFIMITGMQDSKATIEAVRLGAFDYIRKPLDLDAVLLAVEKAQQRMKRRKEGTAAPFGVSTDRPHEIIGAHPAIIEVLKQIAMFGESRVPVLIQGESGTGKELVARALHDTSSPGRPFVAVNCSAVVSTLLESELFGHVKGAFTGADSDKAGKLEAAGDGSIFFDEIGDMAGDLQAKILRVLQEREFERVGSTKTLPFRARVLAATHRDLPAMIQQGQFREDLYYRLAVSTIHVPALRERRSDLPLLTERLLARLSSELHKPIQAIEPLALDLLQRYNWPGNIRELVNVLTRLVLISPGPVVTADDVRAAMGPPALTPEPPGQLKPLSEMERDYIERALNAHAWNISKTAELLQISRVTLRKKIEDYHLQKPSHLA